VVNFVKCAWLAVVCEFRMYVVKRIILNVSAAIFTRCRCYSLSLLSLPLSSWRAAPKLRNLVTFMFLHPSPS
jgi:hypothetical protein